MAWKSDKHVYTWNDLEGKINSEVLHAPRTGGDLASEWPGVHARVIGYVVRPRVAQRDENKQTVWSI